MSSRAFASPPSAPVSTAGVDPTIVRSIRRASEATDIDFGYLMAEAQQESGFHPSAAAPSSSARGLYQFIDTTWLEMVRRYGDRYGAGDYAKEIQSGAGGRPVVADPKTRQEILKLRDDPVLSASLAAEYARSNKADLENALGRPATNTDLYLAHFLGAGGATVFLKNMQQHAGAAAADLLPEAAAANRSVFYNRKTGAARSVADVYGLLATKMGQPTDAFAQVMEAKASTAPAPAGAIPLSRERGPMPLQRERPRLNAPLLAMFNVVALTAMKAIGNEIKLPKTVGSIRAIPTAPEGPAAHRRQREDQLA